MLVSASKMSNCGRLWLLNTRSGLTSRVTYPWKLHEGSLDQCDGCSADAVRIAERSRAWCRHCNRKVEKRCVQGVGKEFDDWHIVTFKRVRGIDRDVFLRDLSGASVFLFPLLFNAALQTRIGRPNPIWALNKPFIRGHSN